MSRQWTNIPYCPSPPGGRPVSAIESNKQTLELQYPIEPRNSTPPALRKQIEEEEGRRSRVPPIHGSGDRGPARAAVRRRPDGGGRQLRRLPRPLGRRRRGRPPPRPPRRPAPARPRASSPPPLLLRGPPLCPLSGWRLRG